MDADMMMLVLGVALFFIAGVAVGWVWRDSQEHREDL